MKEKFLEILKNNSGWMEHHSTDDLYVIDSKDFDKIADELVELKLNNMGWNHRILAHKDGDEMYFQVHEVYYDDKGKPESYTANGVSVGDDSLEGINLILDQMKECSKKPILSIEDFPNEYTGT